MSGLHKTSTLARLLVGLLARAGVTDLIASPGSRSTPYLTAALEHQRLAVHMVVDERSAGFVALGLARACGRPVALLCTSGTAAANYLPAIVEARLSEVPLIVLTADRPTVLQGCHCHQTIDQVRLYGTHVVDSVAIGIPAHEDEFVPLRRQILAAISKASNDAGPVHLNLHTPKPLELPLETATQRQYVEQLIDGVIGDECLVPIARKGASGASAGALHRLIEAVEREPRGLVVCGFEPSHQGLDPMLLARFARASGYVVLMDVTHPLRLNAPAELKPFLVAPFEPLLRLSEWREHQLPSIILQIGRPLLSSAFERWITETAPDRQSPELFLLARSGWPDPTGLAKLVAQGDPNQVLEQMLTRLEVEPSRTSAWSREWFHAASTLEGCVDSWERRATTQSSSSPDDLGEIAALRSVLEALPHGSRLVIGNSLIVRELDLLATQRNTGILAEALRGASGIDGVVSTAVGFAIAHDRPTTLIVGDVSFLHDIGGLWAATSLKSPLAVVVLNNGGGRIFEQLPVARAVNAEALTYWTTPHDFDIASAAGVYRLPYVSPRSASALGDAIVQAHAHVGATIIEVRVETESPRKQTDDLLVHMRQALMSAGIIRESARS
jgi:2-succinyl-5-enolpyruvyl-6-hydroxy-3-cyclohexene-1-carboxylate synthase